MSVANKALIDMLVNEPLIDVSGSIHVGGWPVGGIINKLGYPYSELIKRLHVGFGFQVYGGKANYVSTVVTDANAGVSYILGIHRASYTHYLKDYVFRPLNIMKTYTRPGSTGPINLYTSPATRRSSIHPISTSRGYGVIARYMSS